MVDLQDSSSLEDQSMDNSYEEDSNTESKKKSSKEKPDDKNENNQITNSEVLMNEESSAKSDEFMSLWAQETNDTLSFGESDYNKNNVAVTKEKNMWNDALNKSNGSERSENNLMSEFHAVSQDFSNCIWSTSESDSTHEKSSNQVHRGKDMFSLLLSPLDNGVSSPSADMRSLSLSSPEKHQDNIPDVIDYFAPLSNHNAVQVQNSDAESNINNNDSSLSTLQTINEDSLKELLNSIADK